jgi:antitoxin (DNA-binding transcriptional repressor) of toxin-antitoxin stability system
MRTLTLTQAQEQLPSLIDAVARGEEIAIVHEGKIAARLLGTEPQATPDTPMHVSSAFKPLDQASLERIARQNSISLNELQAWRMDGAR